MQFGAKPLFENVSVKFGDGNRYGLIGANGCGKSTFMKILGSDLEPSAGNVSKDPHERLGKLKQDQLACKADIAVLVTQTYPKGMDRFGEKDGVWICGFQELKSLSFVLRQMLIKTQAVKSSEENKGDKMELLYGYLTSNEFVQNISRIVENYDGMIQQLNSEKKAMHKIWATREKQIWVVQENIASLFGSIKGIAGKELETSSVLELPDSTID